MKANLSKITSLMASIMLALALTLTGCAEDPAKDSGGDDNGGSNQSDNGGGSTPNNNSGGGTTQANAIPVTVGYSASHTISSSGKHWFKFVGTGDPVIFETRG